MTPVWQVYHVFCDYTTVKGLPEKHAVIGLDRAGNPLEVMYNTINDNTISVFHAMKARKSFIKMIGL